MYFTYILRCRDNSYYTGVTSNIDARLWAHDVGYFPKCYTYKRRPVTLEYCEEFEWIEDAINREKQIKGWSRAKKSALIQANVRELSRLAKNYQQFGRPSRSNSSGVPNQPGLISS